MKITVIGTGYVGLVTGVCLAEIGHQVTCVDTNEMKIERLRRGIVPIYEPGLKELITRNAARLEFMSSCAEALKVPQEIIFLAVGTPSRFDGGADLTALFRAAHSLSTLLKGFELVVVKSTVPVGTCDLVEEIVNVPVISNPEFLKEGNAIQDCLHPDRIVIGIQDDLEIDLRAIREMYEPYIKDDPNKMIVMGRRSAELTKYASNAMLATRISFMNEMASLCEFYGANIDDVRVGMGRDPRIGPKFLYAGPGYGGSCFPKDVRALLNMAEEGRVDMMVLQSVSDRNDIHKTKMALKVTEHFEDLTGKIIAVWGLTYKPETDDTRESPAHDLISLWLEHGATVVAHDPKGWENFHSMFGYHECLKKVDCPYEAAMGADALVLVTEWAEYKRPDWQRLHDSMRSLNVFDLRNQWDAELVMLMGFYYSCVGRPGSETKKVG